MREQLYNRSFDTAQRRVDKIRNNPDRELRELVTSKMSDREVLTALVGRKFERLCELSPENKAKIYIRHPDARPYIDFEKLNADARTAILFSVPSKEIQDLYDMNAKDLTMDHYRMFIHSYTKFHTKFFYKKVARKVLLDLKITDWKKLIGDIPRAARDFPIRKVRNQTGLRSLIIERPKIFKYITLDDMKASVISAPTWCRIIEEIPAAKRVYVPRGFIEWAEKEIFRLSLSGKNFKKFGDWRVGLRE